MESLEGELLYANVEVALVLAVAGELRGTLRMERGRLLVGANPF